MDEGPSHNEGSSSEAPKPETLRLLLELARGTPEAQIQANDAVDSKLFQSFAAGSIIIGLVGAGDIEESSLVTVLVSWAVAAFLVLAAAAIWALWSRRYRVPISSQQLWESYWNEEPDSVLHAFLDDLASGYEENERHLTDKHRALRVVLVALLIEAAAIGAVLITTLS